MSEPLPGDGRLPPLGSEDAAGASAHREADPSLRVLVARYGRPFLEGDVLFREGEAGTHAWLLEEGRVRLVERCRAGERSVGVLRAGQLFGEEALLDGAVRATTAVALADGIALAVDRPALEVIASGFPQLAQRLVLQLVRRVRDAEDRVELLLLRDTESKVVGALLKLAGSETGPLELALSPVELSSRVGLDVESVKRVVQRLRDRQYLRIVGERLELLDVDALRRLSTLLGTKEDLRGPRGSS